MGRGRIASTVFASATVAVLLAADAASATAAAGGPTNFSIAVSGQRLTAEQLVPKLDTYIPVPKGPLKITVSWKRNLRGSNHSVVVSSTDGVGRKRCVSGTSCVLALRWSLRARQVTCFSVLVGKG